MTILCALDKYFFTGYVTKFVYVTLFMCNIWWCKKYALTNRCRGCWVNTKQMLSLPCKCLIYCHDRCSRRMNSCLWCFTKIGMLKFIYSEKATKFCKIFILLLTTAHTVKSKVKISQNFVAFSEYMNFNITTVAEYHFRVHAQHCYSTTVVQRISQQNYQNL